MGLDTVELVMDIEADFGIEFSDAVAAHCGTVNEVALYVYGQIQARPESHSETGRIQPLKGKPTFPQVLLRVRELTAALIGVPVDKVLPRSRFVEDLDMG